MDSSGKNPIVARFGRHCSPQPSPTQNPAEGVQEDQTTTFIDQVLVHEYHKRMKGTLNCQTYSHCADQSHYGSNRPQHVSSENFPYHQYGPVAMSNQMQENQAFSPGCSSGLDTSYGTSTWHWDSRTPRHADYTRPPQASQHSSEWQALKANGSYLNNMPQDEYQWKQSYGMEVPMQHNNPSAQWFNTEHASQHGEPAYSPSQGSSFSRFHHSVGFNSHHFLSGMSNLGSSFDQSFSYPDGTPIPVEHSTPLRSMPSDYSNQSAQLDPFHWDDSFRAESGQQSDHHTRSRQVVSPPAASASFAFHSIASSNVQELHGISPHVAQQSVPSNTEESKQTKSQVPLSVRVSSLTLACVQQKRMDLLQSYQVKAAHVEMKRYSALSQLSRSSNQAQCINDLYDHLHGRLLDTLEKILNTQQDATQTVGPPPQKRSRCSRQQDGPIPLSFSDAVSESTSSQQASLPPTPQTVTPESNEQPADDRSRYLKASENNHGLPNDKPQTLPTTSNGPLTAPSTEPSEKDTMLRACSSNSSSNQPDETNSSDPIQEAPNTSSSCDRHPDSRNVSDSTPATSGNSASSLDEYMNNQRVAVRSNSQGRIMNNPSSTSSFSNHQRANNGDTGANHTNSNHDSAGRTTNARHASTANRNEHEVPSSFPTLHSAGLVTKIQPISTSDAMEHATSAAFQQSIDSHFRKASFGATSPTWDNEQAAPLTSQQSTHSHTVPTNFGATLPACNYKHTAPPASLPTIHSGGRITNAVTQVFTRWYERNKRFPYPDARVAAILSSATGVDACQVRKWFSNKRLRERNVHRMDELVRLRQYHRQHALSSAEEKALLARDVIEVLAQSTAANDAGQ